MADFTITDALTGDTVAFDYATGDAKVTLPAQGVSPVAHSIFFPGCSFINYAMPLVAAVYDLLEKAGEVDGISVLCCGKILSFEEDGARIREGFEEDLRAHIAHAGITRLVCACPNCVKALHEALALDPRTKDVEVAVLPQVLAEMGYALDPATCARLIKGDEQEPVLLCTHDSCPDRGVGAFADGLRALLPEGLWADPPHARSRSICCGSLPRAAGKFEQADKCARINGEEAQALEADAIVTACMSCTFQLNMAQPFVQCVHYLELLFDWRIDWSTVGAWMKLRFLFQDTLEEEEGARSFAGLTRRCPSTVADKEALKRQEEGTLSAQDAAGASEVTLSNVDVITLGEEDER